MKDINQNILLIYPSLDWAKEERLLMRDTLVYIESGFKVFAVVVKDSFLHHRMKSLGVELIFHRGGGEHWWSWRAFNYLIPEIINKNINFVQTVGQTYIWPIAHLLRRFPKIPFIVTLPPGSRFKKHFADRVFYRRVDRFIASSLSVKNSLIESTHISKRRIEYFPYGAFWNPPSEEEIEIYNDDHPVIFSTYLPPHYETIQPLFPILYAFKSLLAQYPDQEFRLHIYSLKDWRQNILYQELTNLLWELEISEVVKLKSEEMRSSDFFKHIDIWISPHLEDFDDIIISAIAAGVPSIAPRCETLTALLDQPELVAKSCKHGDARDLKVQMIELIRDFKSYVEGATSFCQRMTGFLIYSDYKKSHVRLVEALITMRRRKFKSL